MRLVAILLLGGFVLFLVGCPEEEEVINRFQFSDQVSQAVIGGWGRFPFNFNMYEKAGFYEWEQETSEGKLLLFISKLFVINDIIGNKCPNNPSYCYLLVVPKGKEDIKGEREIAQQILSDLQDNSWDMTGDNVVDERDQGVIIDAADQPRGKTDMAQAPAMLEIIKSFPNTSTKGLAVKPATKAITTTWAQVRR